MNKRFAFALQRVILLSLLVWHPGASAGYLDDVGFFSLQTTYGAALADGSGVIPTLVEATVNVGDMQDVWAPDPTNSDFAGVNFIQQTPIPAPLAGLYSNHATGSASRMVGTDSSMTSGVAFLAVYEAVDWLANFLNVATNVPPATSVSRIANHSWVAEFGEPEIGEPDLNIESLRRIDWLIERDEFVQVVGNTNGSPLQPVFANAYNVIAAGRTDGSHSTGSLALDADYVAGRANPHVVVPIGSSSAATSVISSAATLLIDAANEDEMLSLEPDQTPRHGSAAPIKSAATSEVVKALLMAGADRTTLNPTAANISDYRQGAANQTHNGLDTRFGAGQLNIHTSYEILTSGEQNSFEDGGGSVLWSGFDYDPAFGGAEASNDTANYFISTTTTAAHLRASLVWNLSIGGENAYEPNPMLHNLDLQLWLLDGSNELLVAHSTSTIDNTENLWTTLLPESNYALRVVNGGIENFAWDYGIAWNVQAVPLPATLPMLACALAGLRITYRRAVSL